jgi:GNAT superfamily N-acetyltransferase
MPSALTRRCVGGDWRDVRRLHIKLSLGFPLVVDVELNDVLATPDSTWQEFVQTCAADPEQALHVAVADDGCVGMCHVHLVGTLARLGMLFVDAGARRQGIAAALVSGQTNWAAAAGATDLICHIPEASSAGQLASALGWQRSEDVTFTKHGLTERRWTARIQPGPEDARTQ